MGEYVTEDGDETEEEYEIASPKQLSKMLPPKSRKRAKTGSTPGAGPSSAPLHLQEGPKPEGKRFHMQLRPRKDPSDTK